ncbi:DUF4911 domain-containing protein [Desulfolutivibrio sulfoxidireducens]|uniref:DUF4911 domain-containing protein n=1 Tax=Desulfolutivibrio sulfoxidireducens TaxID=2773299 RepID=UPI00159DDABA|nr:DUF4911 domain-containing protein [Desulfolutivibrio sulfoxidireducens]QLA15746.1 DUF4911 domain-containing protein [Desulfolutivibrio sulfoxidireducens]QLA19351.1 DUF4911 domain-containing protein [Desulfolutivibrio sulfoxidireducens]
MKRPRRPRPYAAPRRSRRLYIGLPGRDVGLLRFLLEGYGHLACMTVVDRYAAVVRLSFAPGRRAEVEEFLAAAAVEIVGLAVRFDPGLDKGGEMAGDPGVTAS